MNRFPDRPGQGHRPPPPPPGGRPPAPPPPPVPGRPPRRPCGVCNLLHWFGLR